MFQKRKKLSKIKQFIAIDLWWKHNDLKHLSTSRLSFPSIWVHLSIVFGFYFCFVSWNTSPVCVFVFCFWITRNTPHCYFTNFFFFLATYCAGASTISFVPNNDCNFNKVTPQTSNQVFLLLLLVFGLNLAFGIKRLTMTENTLQIYMLYYFVTFKR